MTSSAPASKLCVNCKHVATSTNGWENFRCLSPNNGSRINLVAGHKEYFVPFCKQQRENTDAAFCSPAGRWWEEKPAVEVPVPTMAQAIAKATGKIRGISADDL